MSDNETKLSRRSFFRLSGGAIAAAIVAPKLLAEKIINIPVELGWTWYIDKSKVDPTLSEIVAHTLRNNKNKIVDNMFEKNSLLMRLKDGQKVQLNIERIPEEIQTERMIHRMIERRAERRIAAGLNPTPKLNECDNIIEDNSTREYYPGNINDFIKLEKKYGQT